MKITIVNLIIIGLIITGNGCERKKTIRIGFSGCLSGKLSELGIEGRNAVIMAVNEINKSGGINGHLIELIVKDDMQDPATAIHGDEELVREGVVAIIGHMTSAMTKAVIPFINQKKIVLLSPTSTTNELTGIDDYFLRTALPDKIQSEHISKYAIEKLRLKTIAIIYDLSNRSFSEGWQTNFKSSFELGGGRVLHSEAYTSDQNNQYLEICKKIIAKNPEGLLIISGAIDTALFCQQIRKLASSIPIVSSGWAQNSALLRYGGLAVEGIIIPQTINENSISKNYLIFKENFKKFYGKNPGHGATGAYDAANLLFKALSETDDPLKLKNAILNQKIFHGLQGDIMIDKYGDASRKTYLISVKNGQFVTIE
ncbi:MAG: ABC transporter substrate-binding protein [Desulfobacterales bacterium]|nr:ABC transporter substrate-binding protein [Desulfobacterales bacterium]